MSAFTQQAKEQGAQLLGGGRREEAGEELSSLESGEVAGAGGTG